MKEQLITFETAKLAKEVGCNLETQHIFSECYTEDGEKYNSLSVPYSKSFQEIYEAHPQSLLQKWLREVYNIHLVVDFFKPNKTYLFTLYSDIKKIEGEEENSYEEALEKGLQEALNLHSVVEQSEQLCHCGKKEDSRYSPCCSLEHWHDKFS